MWCLMYDLRVHSVIKIGIKEAMFANGLQPLKSHSKRSYFFKQLPFFLLGTDLILILFPCGENLLLESSAGAIRSNFLE